MSGISSSSTATTAPVIEVSNLVKVYVLGQANVYALQGISLQIHQGEFVAVMGPSGSGKSTFMNILGCLDRPTNGDYWLMGSLVSRMSATQLADIRNRYIGFVFQGFNLLGSATSLKNVALPLMYRGMNNGERKNRAQEALRLVGLEARTNHHPTQLSGGQQQRVAIARALVTRPSLLLADEPTGNLDSRTSIEVMAILQALNEQNLTIILVTHELDIAMHAKRIVTFSDGCILQDRSILSPSSAYDQGKATADTASRQRPEGVL